MRGNLAPELTCQPWLIATSSVQVTPVRIIAKPGNPLNIHILKSISMYVPTQIGLKIYLHLEVIIKPTQPILIIKNSTELSVQGNETRYKSEAKLSPIRPADSLQKIMKKH